MGNVRLLVAGCSVSLALLVGLRWLHVFGPNSRAWYNALFFAVLWAAFPLLVFLPVFSPGQLVLASLWGAFCGAIGGLVGSDYGSRRRRSGN
jgi:membrane associated rhomboid family serine protease